MQIIPVHAVPAAAAQHEVSPRLAKAAHQFEASLMQELLKPMQAKGSFAADDTQEDSGDALTSFGSEAMAQAMSEKGGFGIARQIIAHLAPQQAPAQPAASGAIGAGSRAPTAPNLKIS